MTTNTTQSDQNKSASVGESYVPMQLLREMLLGEAKKPTLKKASRSVYHRDYLKTKNKKYRRYTPEDGNQSWAYKK